MSMIGGQGSDSKKLPPSSHMPVHDPATVVPRELRAAMVDALADILREERRRAT